MFRWMWKSLLFIALSMLVACGSDSSSANEESGDNLSSANEISSSSVPQAEWNSETNTLKDTRDGEVYKTVKIGDQVWMAENLNFKPEDAKLSVCGGGPNESQDTSLGDCEKYGRLYTLAEALGLIHVKESLWDVDYSYNLLDSAKDEQGYVRGICPGGWHLPDTLEWKTLFVKAVERNGASAGQILRSTTEWRDVDGQGQPFADVGTDDFGFTILPAGIYNSYLYSYIGVTEYASFWTATLIKNLYGVRAGFHWDNEFGFAGDGGTKDTGASIRCVKNEN